MNEFLEQFLIESRELIDQATHDLLALEHDPSDRARLDSAFRAFHTLKGGASIVDFSAMAELAHAVEDLLSEARTGARPFSKNLTELCLSGLDQMTLWLATAEEQEALPADTDTTATATVTDFKARAAHHTPPTQAAPQPTTVPATAGEPMLPPHAVEVLKAQIDMLALPADAGSGGRNGAALNVIRNILHHFGINAPPGGEPAENVAPPADVPPAGAAPGDPRSEPPRALRVDMARIDAIVKLAGELTVAKNAVGYAVYATGGEDDQNALRQSLQQSHAQLERLTSELLRAALGARVLPLRQVFQRFPRLVRTMAESLGKPVRLVTQGEATEADKTVVEGLFEPLLHILRNAVDHGIESAAQRAASGKPSPAVIQLAASRQSEHVVVEVSDDGRGIDVSAIRGMAVRRGLVSAEAAAALSDEQAVRLIFMPGFSTAGEVTAHSGRGVGMDAVRAAVELLGGQISIHTRHGAGTTIRLTLPFTVVLTKVLTVDAGGQVFGVPFDAVVETRQIPLSGIFAIGAAKAVFHRGKTIPLIELSHILNVAQPRPARDQAHAVIVEFLGESAAIDVDRVGGQLEIMLKPLEGLLTGIPGIAGTTLLGDGRVLIVLELQELLK